MPSSTVLESAADSTVDGTVDGTVDQVENALIPLVRYLSSARTWRQIADSAQIPLDRSRYLVLRGVAESEPVRTTALAEHMGVDPSTMSRHITVLDQAGYLTRTADPDDGRAQAVALTPAGREVMEKTRAARHDLITDALAAWDDADRMHLAALLGRLADDFLRVERDT
ncbi:MAG TPA: MarR family transcriptional regulator [Acidimicrobiia bacterium]|jgi:DNA-binding MarR family transcriptional regulator